MLSRVRLFTAGSSVLLGIGVTALVLAPGCSLFDASGETTTAKLPPILGPSDSITLRIMFIERSVDDPLLGPILWREVEEIGTAAPSTRQRLRENGFRVGHVGSNPPTALQTLLGLSPEIGLGASDDVKQRNGRQWVVRSGSETELDVSHYHPVAEVTIRADDESATAEYENARGVLRIRPRRLQDAWVRLEVEPELHHGFQEKRYNPGETGWGLAFRQKIEKFYDQRFSLDLTLGEFVVITADEDCAGTLGGLCFRGNETDKKVQRLLVIRLERMEKPEDTMYAD